MPAKGAHTAAAETFPGRLRAAKSAAANIIAKSKKENSKTADAKSDSGSVSWWSAMNQFAKTFRKQAKSEQLPQELMDFVAGLELADAFDLPLQADAGIHQHAGAHGLAEIF